MKQPKLILASASPRRREMLEMMGVPFTVRVAGVDESHGELSPDRLVTMLAARKSEAAFADLSVDEKESAVVVGCDTVVALDGTILEKPSDPIQAAKMLRSLSGRTHTVWSGLSVRNTEKEVRECVSTAVTFRELTDGEIDGYVASGEPMDKAGAYGIQGKAGAFVKEIRGDFFTVVGMPLCRLTEILRDEFGLDIFREIV